MIFETVHDEGNGVAERPAELRAGCRSGTRGLPSAGFGAG
jgi:hypothetical protein